MKRVCIIAEAGVNHNGSLEMAREMVRVAAAAGADMIKFQTFRPENLVTRTAARAEYQKTADPGGGRSQFDMLKNLALSMDDHKTLAACCQEHGIGFLSTAFDLPSIDFLAGLGQDTWKVPSGEITNLPYLRRIGGMAREIMLSTGMAGLGEVADALDVLRESGTPWDKIIVLHCTTLYPAPVEHVNLMAMRTIGRAFPGVRVGYSDHTMGIEVAIAAAALGAAVIEKHFTLDRGLEGPDHKASLLPDELHAMVVAIRNVARGLGDGVKRPSPGELINRAVARKSIVAAAEIRKGECFTEENITVKRPGTGISPMCWDQLAGRRASRDYKPDDLIEW